MNNPQEELPDEIVKVIEEQSVVEPRKVSPGAVLELRKAEKKRRKSQKISNKSRRINQKRQKSKTKFTGKNHRK